MKAGRIFLKMRGTVSRLWAKTSGWASTTSCRDSGRPLKSGIRISMPVLGEISCTARMVSA